MTARPTAPLFPKDAANDAPSDYMSVLHVPSSEGPTVNSAGASVHEPKVSLISHAIPTVFVVDDDVSVRESLESLVRRVGWEPQTFPSGKDFLSRPRVLVPSCLVLEVSLPDMNGLDMQKLVADRVEMPVIFITAYVDVSTTVRAMKAGAVEFLTKPFRDEVLLRAMKDAIERSRAALRNEAKVRTLRARYALLTGRQREVMALVVSGQLNKQVGSELGISEITVQAHRGKVMRKMKADSLASLVRMAADLRLKIDTDARACATRSKAPSNIWDGSWTFDGG